MRSLLWVGDAGVPSGFALATHKILETLCKEYRVTVLGINYRGDPHQYPYDIYCAAVHGDWMGVKRLIWMCDKTQPDVIVIQQDPWNLPYYVRELRKIPEYKDVKIVAAVAVDGKNIDGRWLKGIDHAIFWTKFGFDEARAGGYEGTASVIPLGVDLDVYRPMDKYEARMRKLPIGMDDMFIVGNVNRNQPRKRWDLTVRYFANWVNTKKVTDAWLYLHTSPTGEEGINVGALANYYGVLDRLIVAEPSTWYGISEEEMRYTYNCFDLQISTTQGEGFGLTTFEGMACGVPQIIPDWSALGELCKDAAWLVPCKVTAVGPPYVNVLGGVADEESFINALNYLYENQFVRDMNRQAGLECVNQPRYRWEHIGSEYSRVLSDVLNSTVKAVEEEVQV